MTKEDQEDEQSVLNRLLGGDTVATPATLSAGLRWLLSKLRQELSCKPFPGEQAYLTVSGVAKLYGVTKAQAHSWMCRLRELGKVRVQVPLSGKNDRGNTMYNIADIEQAFEENAQRVKNIKRA